MACPAETIASHTKTTTLAGKGREMINQSELPILPFNDSVPPDTTTISQYDQIYLFSQILNDLQPGLGDAYIASYPPEDQPTFDGLQQNLITSHLNRCT